MTWTATLVSVQDNPVPNDTVFAQIEFEKDGEVFKKELKLSASNIKTKKALKAALKQHTDDLDAFELLKQELSDKVGEDLMEVI